MNNLDYFELSRINSKVNIDFSNPKGVVVIPKSKDEVNALTKANKELIDNIVTYSVLSKDEFFDEIALNKITEKIINIIEQTNHINYTGFCVYFQVLKFSYNAYKNQRNLNQREKILLMRQIIDAYIENRHEMYDSHGYSNQVLQVMCDAASSRRNGSTGASSLSAIMQENCIANKKVAGFMDGQNAYLIPDKNNFSSLLTVLNNNDVNFVFSKERDNKIPDLAFRIYDSLFVLEHKLTNGKGGGQNMEINELISFINQSEINQNMHYISCLQGDYIQELCPENREPKAAAQYKNIITYLREHPNNYFVNEYGLNEMIKEYV